MKRVMVFVMICLAGYGFLSGQIAVPIAQARLAPVGDTVTITGVVLNGSELGVIRYIQDPTGGLAIYDGAMTFLQRGDSVLLSGIMDNYNQLLELRNIHNDTVYSSGHPLPAPAVITPSQFGEVHESIMIRINNATFSTPGGTFSGNTNYNIISNGQQAQIRITNGSPLVGQLIPTGVIDLVGIGSQFSYSNPNAGYQLLLRDTADIISNVSISFTSPVSVSTIANTGFTLTWTTNISGTTEIFYGYTPSLGSYASHTGQTQNHYLQLTGLQPADIIYVQAFSVAGTDTAFAGTNVYATRSLSTGDIKVYFTSTVDTSYNTGVKATQLDDLLDDTLIAYINRAEESIDFAIYNFNTQNISNITAALNTAHSNGIDIRVVYDGSTANQGVSSLDPAIGKIASPGSSEYGIMHNKFMIIDAFHTDPTKPVVWTGSMNWTETCVNQYANNVVIIQDQSLAKAYTLEFEEMFGSTGLQPDTAVARFGPYKINNTPHEFLIGNTRVKSFFSPSDGVNAQIISHIESAMNQVYVNTMLITRSDIAYGLRDKSIAGKDVRVIVNSDGDCTQLVVDELTTQLGANFREFGESYILHNKLMIIDPNPPLGGDPLVWTGSHNWSSAADQRNDENSLVIHDLTIANLYLQEFMQRWALGVPLSLQTWPRSMNDVRLSPNPSDGLFTLHIHAKTPGNGSFHLMGLDGREIFSEEIQIHDGLQEHLFNPDVADGIYLFRIITPDGTSTGKLIIY